MISLGTQNLGSDGKSVLLKKFQHEGILYLTESQGEWWSDPHAFGQASESVSFLGQLLEENLVEVSPSGELLLPWQALYNIRRDSDLSGSYSLLLLPPDCDCRPSIQSNGSLEDREFNITIRQWVVGSARTPLSGNPKFFGALVQFDNKEFLLNESVWRLKEKISFFYKRPPEKRTGLHNRNGWAEIRQLAIAAKAEMSNFLAKTVVLIPEHLTLKIQKNHLGELPVVEVEPVFEGSPRRWLELFDRYSSVQERYDIPDREDGSGLVQVVIPHETRKVLTEIKRWPKRVIAGPRAEAFLANPIALLGESAASVINVDEFEQQKLDAGIFYQRFYSQVQRAEDSSITEVSIVIDMIQDGHQASSEIYSFIDHEDLNLFIKKIEKKLNQDYRYCNWKGYELEFSGDTKDQLETLSSALTEWKQASVQIRYTDVHDLSQYAERVDCIGIEKQIYSPFIARKDDQSKWVPENILVGISYKTERGEETKTIYLDPFQQNLFAEKVKEARVSGSPTISFMEQKIPIKEAENIIHNLENSQLDINEGRFEEKIKRDDKKLRTKSLVIKHNIDKVDYEERRRKALEWDPLIVPAIPESLNPQYALLPHQKEGLSRLQSLWKNTPEFVRGVLLADDMGLGKTLQILAFLSWCFIQKKDIAPALVVAPVSLLDNWNDEIHKFFKPGTFQTLTLYGKALKEKKVSQEEIDPKLLDEGITLFLKKGWRGNANLVLTTYETLRNHEFSFSSMPWSVMICDEAQKIKNPNTSITQAAKKQNVLFKIACTGTPVENSLVDLWCLFDFIQPGLLGALNQFGKKYRKPIEAKSEDEQKMLEELRQIIKPQLIRRMKKDVIKDLPQKIIVESCRSLTLSNTQRNLYSHVIHLFKKKNSFSEEDKNSGVHHLALIHELKKICTDPQPIGANSNAGFSESSIAVSPKLAWLLQTLQNIRSMKEKVIIFVELHDVQRMLQYHIRKEFGFSPGIINGETPVGERTNPSSRGMMIKTFEKIDGFHIVILSPKAVGFGVNIQSANHVVHFMRPWNPAIEDQATDRAYRIGQKKDVYVYYPIVRSDDFLTYDEKLDNLLNWKRSLSEDMLNGYGEISLAEFLDLSGPDGERLVEDRLITVSDLKNAQPYFFECFCAVLWRHQGFLFVKVTPKSGDGGIDVLAIKENSGCLIQCKSSSREGTILGWDAIKDVVAGQGLYRVRHPNVKFELYAVTNQYFNDNARIQAEINQVKLLEIDDLAKILESFPVKRIEVEKELI